MGDMEREVARKMSNGKLGEENCQTMNIRLKRHRTEILF
jgi:hypothetical protein